MITENLSTLKIHKLTQAQYDRELKAGRIDENALYLTPDEDIDLSPYATIDYVDSAISAIPTPDVSGQINTHNTDANAHSDIRDSISANEAAISVLLNGSDPEIIDGVNDLINYVNEHGSEVTGIKADIKENADNIEQLNTLVGDTSVSEQISAAINPLSSEIANVSKAAQTSLDNHINNKSNPHGVTLSQLGVTATAAELNYVDGVTSNIQTQISSLSSEIANKSAVGHKHTKSEITDFPTSMTPTTHNQAASTITAGTFAGQVVANSGGQAPGTSLLRNSKLVSADTNPTVNGEICWTYK